MVSLQDLERPPVRVVMLIIILIEIYLIGTNYSASFDDYITIFVIVLAIPAAYFAYNLLKFRHREIEPHEAVIRKAVPSDASQETREEVGRLLKSEKYQQYQRARQRRLLKKASEQAEAEQQGELQHEMDEIAKQLQDKQQQIYDI